MRRRHKPTPGAPIPGAPTEPGLPSALRGRPAGTVARVQWRLPITGS